MVSSMHYPCLITVDKDIFVPRLPSYRLSQVARERPVRFLSFKDLPDQDLSRYGLVGSPTSVERIFPPEKTKEQVWIEGSAPQQTDALYQLLLQKKFVM